MARSIRLFQNCVEERHFTDLTPGFEPLDFRHNPRPGLREFQIFDELVASGLHHSADVVGAVSSRFAAKTRMSGTEIRRWIETAPGYEFYAVNPWPQWCYTAFNSFDRAPIIHADPMFNQRFQKVVQRAGLSLDVTQVGRQHNGNYGMSSYWFATTAYWERFMGELVHPLIRLSRRELGEELFGFLYQPMPYYGQSAHRAGALPFLLERLTSLYVAAEFADRAIYLPRTRQQVLEACLFPFERELVTQFGDEIDAWDAAGAYDQKAMRYFQGAVQHTAHGWLVYTHMQPLVFDHGDPRPHLPWFMKGQTDER